MLELLLMKGGKGRPYPDSGPGTKLLQYGDEDLGYFGPVSSSELMTTSELSSQILLGATQLNENEDWLKFFYKGKVLFISKRSRYSSLSWNQLYSAGLIYGTDDEGKYPAAISVSQAKVITKDQHSFLVQTITGDEVDPTGVTSTSFTVFNGVVDSMYTQLLYRVMKEEVTGYPSDKWDKFSWLELEQGSREIMRESGLNNGQPSYFLIRGRNTGTTPIHAFISGKDLPTPSYYWRPVLELIRADHPPLKLNINYLNVTGDFITPVADVTHSLPTGSEESSLIPLSGFSSENQNFVAKPSSLTSSTDGLSGNHTFTYANESVSRVSDLTFDVTE